MALPSNFVSTPHRAKGQNCNAKIADKPRNYCEIARFISLRLVASPVLNTPILNAEDSNQFLASEANGMAECHGLWFTGCNPSVTPSPLTPMLVLGIESSCDETGLALYDSDKGLLAHALHTQIALHAEYGGVVPELASRDHIRRLTPLLREVLVRADKPLTSIDAIAYTRGPGLAGALLVGCAFAEALAMSLGKPTLPVHHLEGHLLSPLLSTDPPRFPFIALLVSGGHTQLMRVSAVGQYETLGETLDDAAGEAFDKSAKLLGLPYPGGAALSALAETGKPGVFELPRPLLHSGDLNFSFSGLKTAVLNQVRQQDASNAHFKADLAFAFQEAIVDVLAQKSLRALKSTGLRTLVVAGGVGANRQLRLRLDSEARKRAMRVHYPELTFCTDNGAMIALAGALRLQNHATPAHARKGDFSAQPRWPLAEITLNESD